MSPALEALGERSRLADAVYERLRQAIFAGEIAPGSRLSIPGLAGRLGVSRSPVREAVLRLVRDGLAVDQPRRGVALIVLDAQNLLPVYEVRAVLEGLAARAAAARVAAARAGGTVAGPGPVTGAGPAGGTGPAGDSGPAGDPGPVTGQLARLTDAVAVHAATVADNDLAAAREADLAFHRLTRELAGNAPLSGFLDQIQDKVRLAMATTLITPGPSLALADHRAIFEAIASGDPDLAEERAKAHVTRLEAALAAAAHQVGRAPGAAQDAGGTDGQHGAGGQRPAGSPASADGQRPAGKERAAGSHGSADGRRAAGSQGSADGQRGQRPAGGRSSRRGSRDGARG